MERTLRVKNLLARSASDFFWFESLFKEKVEYLDAFRDLLNTRQWVRDVAANSRTMNMLAKSQMLMREVAASAPAMQAVAKSAQACQLIESPLQNHRTALHNALNNASSVFRKTTSTIGNGSGTWDEGANTSTIYIPTFCSDDGDTDYDVKSLFADNKQIVRISRHSGNIAVTTGVALRGVRVVGSGSSSGNVTFDIFTVI